MKQAAETIKVINILADGTVIEDISKVKISKDHMIYRVCASLANKYSGNESESVSSKMS